MKAEDLPDFITALDEEFKAHGLVLNSKKSAVVNIKNHALIHSPEAIRGIPYSITY